MSASADAPGGGASSGDTDFEAMWSSDGMTRSFSSATAGLPADLPFLFQAGQRFGPYLIIRPLGKGGMGQVYEAEESESGRRVAIKILSRGLGDDEERERFLSEGRVAASLSHPNSVYIFGTCEVQGLPVIAMELAPGGTLKDLLVDDQPLAPPAAVDAILQVIAGLREAAALGILHRDIKPSNCFVDRDGRILVGDFGLSIATLAREPGTSAGMGMIAGTPGFASPEQLRGEPLDVRSDIYSVGATIYYLLTGRPPFVEERVTVLVTRMATETPASPAAIRSDVPKGLAAVVMRCLTRTPQERFADYRALAAALEPFRSTTQVAAGLSRRFFANVADSIVSSLALTPVNMLAGPELVASGTTSLAVLSVPAMAVIIGYYGILEGRFGAAAGKAMLGLRVAGQGGSPPGILRGLLRAAIFSLPAHVVSRGLNYAFVERMATPSAGTAATTAILTAAGFAVSMACLALLFSTARRRNGYAALHDLGSGTRVVVKRRAIESRHAAAVPAIDPDNLVDGVSRIGPYVVRDPARPAVPSAGPAIVDGYDDRLRRKVWIEFNSPDTPALPPLRRDLGRPARARWLAGRRTADECWDAFEAIPGQPLTRAIAYPQPWSRVRHWLSDLTHEIVQGLADGSLPVLDIDRVWVGADDQVRLLDWPAPRLDSGQAPRQGSGQVTDSGSPAVTNGPVPARDLATAGRFLYRVAVSALRGGLTTSEAAALRGEPAASGETEGRLSPPLPLSARRLLHSLRDGRAGSAEALTSDVDGSLRAPAIVTRSTRLIQLAFCAAIPIFFPVVSLAALALYQRLPQTDPPAFALKSTLDRMRTLDREIAAGRATVEMTAERQAIETYVAARLRSIAANPATWSRRIPSFRPGDREQAARALAAHPNPSAEELQRADAAWARLLRNDQRQLERLGRLEVRWQLIVRTLALGWIAAAVLGLLGALAARGGVMFGMLGTAVVRRDGAPASRLRTTLRALVAWTPAVAMFAVPRMAPGLAAGTPRGTVFHYAAMAVLIAGGIWAVRRPARGIQDWVAGTWLVPR